MKKSVILIGSVLCLISLSAIAINSWQNDKNQKATKNITGPKAIGSTNFLELTKVTAVEDIAYDYDTRFIHTVTLNQVKQAKSIADLIPTEVAEKIEVYSKNKLGITTVLASQEFKGNGEQFNEEQLALLSKVAYSNNLYVKSDCKSKNERGVLSYYDLTYYMTVTPEKQASYKQGKEILIEKMKMLTKTHITKMRKSEIRPGRLSFTIDKNGTISHVEIENSCGYNDVDQAFKSALHSINGEWIPAQNASGSAIEQTLTFFYGIQGC